MNTNHPAHPTESVSGDGWHPCSAGDIQAVAEQQRKHQKKAAMGRRAVIGAVVLLIASGVAFFASGGGDFTALPGNSIACSAVRGHAEAYVSGDLDELLAQRVSEHCEHCKACRDYIAARRRLTTQDRSSAGGIAVAVSR